MGSTEKPDHDLEAVPDADQSVDRRGFMRSALATAALAGIPASLTAQGTGTGGAGRGQPEAPPPRPLGNGEPPAMVFQPYPGGTGSYLEKLARERGREAFERARFTVEGFRGPVPTSEEELAFLPAHRLAALIQSRKISSVQITDIYLNRLKRLDPQLLCAVSILEGQAREAAQQADAEIRAGRYRGPLHGIPYGIKDLFAVRGTKTTWGSKAHADQVIDVDSEVYIRLRDAGAVLIAKLATGLFAQGDQWYRGQTKNPWNLAQGASGSSAGPGSATAAGCVAFGIGDRKSTRLNSSHLVISYAVFCLKKKKTKDCVTQPWKKKKIKQNLGGTDDYNDIQAGLEWIGIQNQKKWMKDSVMCICSFELMT